VHLPTSSSRAIISHYNIALGQLEVEDYPVCCMGSGSDYRARIAATTTGKIKERLEIPESNSSMMRFPGRLHTRRRRRCCCCCCCIDRHGQVFSHAHHQHHQILSSLYSTRPCEHIERRLMISRLAPSRI